MQQPPLNHHMNTTNTQHRVSGESRTSGVYTANGDGGMTIPQAPPGQLFNGQTRKGSVTAGAKPFDIARSPPNPATKSTLPPWICRMIASLTTNLYFRHQACPLQVLPSGHMSGRRRVPFSTLDRHGDRHRSLQILCKGTQIAHTSLRSRVGVEADWDNENRV